MINLPLRRTALAAAAVAVLSLPAAAQSDAAFASALGKIPSGLATMAELKTRPQAPAAAATQVKGPTAPADIWKKILDGARKGTFTTTPKGIIMRNRRVQIDHSATSATHHSATVFSTIRPDGQEGVGGAQFVDSEYNMDTASGRITADYWVFGVDRSGQLLEAARHTDINGKDRVTENLGLADPKTKARYDAMLAFWAAR